MTDKIHVALAFCDPKGTYCRHAAVTLASIFQNTKSAVCAHIIHDDTLTAGNRQKLQQLADSFSQSISFLNVENLLDAGKIDVSKLTIDGARGTLFRLLIPQLIDVPKIIYLDCDIVVALDVAEMWNAGIGAHALGAVRDVWSQDYLKGKEVPWRLSKAWEMMGIAKDSYFNAGVLLMNLDRIRGRYDFLGEVGAFYAHYKNAITLADQDCLNHIFAGDVYFLNEKFNRIETEGVNPAENSSIWHMAGGAKPWDLYTRPGVDELYWHYLRRTPFCESEDALITTLLSDMSSSKYAHLHTSDCVKRVKKQMADNIFRAHIWTIPHIFLASRKYKKKSPEND